MRLLFIVPNLEGSFYKATHPHMGVAYMVSILEKNGHLAEVIDLRVDSKISGLDKKVSLFNPEVIGITFMSRGYKEAYKFVDMVKHRYGCKVIIGGPHAALFQEEVLKSCNADYVVIGEGEYAITSLANGEALEKIKNLIWKDGDKIVKNEVQYIEDLDKLPFPDYTKFPLKRYIDKKIPLLTSRGCPFSCVYCSISGLMGKRWRARSAKNIAEEIELWKNRGYVLFQIADDNFTLNRERVEEFCNLLIEKNLNVKWELRNGIRADTVDEELLKLMKRAGCDFVSYGVESLDQEVLDASKKGLKVDIAEKAIQASLKVGLKTGAFFIIGLPKDTPEKFKKVLDFARKYCLDEIKAYNCVPYPKTELENWIKKNGRFIVGPERYLNYASYWQNNALFETPEFSARDRAKAFREAEKIVWKKLLIKECGYTMAMFVYPIWINPQLRKVFIRPGLALWTVIRKIRARSKHA